MNEKIRNAAVTALFCLFFVAGAVLCVTHRANAYSLTERRRLEQLPTPTVSTVLDTSFMTDFEDYTLDQFPLRDTFRTVKALSHFYLFAQRDNNDIYLQNGVVSKLEYPLSENSIQQAAEKFEALYHKHFTNANAYYAVVPDKNYFTAAPGGYPSIDYDRLSALLAGGMKDFTEIPLFDTLSADDYYRTDTHWRQEQLGDVADRIAQTMQIADRLTDTAYTQHTYTPFYGVYYGQAALPIAPDTLVYLQSETLQNSTVYNYETGKTGPVYDTDRLTGNDPYEAFLSGAAALLRIDNPSCTDDRTLVVFRDSFGSSLVPLLVSAYKTVYVADIRYITSDYLAELVDPGTADDVLFLYSTLVLNNSTMLK